MGISLFSFSSPTPMSCLLCTQLLCALVASRILEPSVGWSSCLSSLSLTTMPLSTSQQLLGACWNPPYGVHITTLPPFQRLNSFLELRDFIKACCPYSFQDIHSLLKYLPWGRCKQLLIVVLTLVLILVLVLLLHLGCSNTNHWEKLPHVPPTARALPNL